MGSRWCATEASAKGHEEMGPGWSLGDLTLKVPGRADGGGMGGVPKAGEGKRLRARGRGLGCT